METRIADHQPWPARAFGLAALGTLLGAAFGLLVDVPGGAYPSVLRMSAASFVAVGGIAFAFTVERLRWAWAAGFAVVAGLVVALVFAWNGSPTGWIAGTEWRIFCALLAIAVAAPLFQTARDAGGWRPDPSAIHAHAWTNIVLWFAAWAFVLASWLMAQLLGALFGLIGIEFLADALRELWVNLTVVGAALGAAIALLRDRDRVLGSLQRVMTTVLSVLAPVLALGLVLFVLALPFTGLEPLWDKTQATTPILLAAVAASFVLANAIVGNSAEEEARAPALRWSAMALGAVMAPLSIVAAISTWLRIDQYGFTPERLWALVFVIVVLAVAAAYLWTLARGRRAWGERVRRTNVRLAMGVCGLAVLLAMPILDFGAISTRDQVARLESGKVAPDRFDWAALRFDFGPRGREALARLSKSGMPEVRRFAARALATRDRWAMVETTAAARRAKVLERELRVLPRPVPVPEPLRLRLSEGSICASQDCTLVWTEGAAEAVAIGFGCPQCLARVTRLVREPKGEWRSFPLEPGPSPAPVRDAEASIDAQRRALQAGRVEVREVMRRQVFLDGKPIAEAF